MNRKETESRLAELGSKYQEILTSNGGAEENATGLSLGFTCVFLYNVVKM